MISQDQILELFVTYAYQPWVVYGLVIGLLTLSSLGLPLPEEVTLISAGFLGYFATHPDLYPPPAEGLTPIHPPTLAAVCFVAVFGSDFLIYSLGRFARKRVRKSQRMRQLISRSNFRKATNLTKRYGYWMAGIFRFTPVLRFPGHMACGFLGVPAWKFAAVDGTAALLTVPTQILFLSYYGNEILYYFHRFKIVLIVLLILILIGFVVHRYHKKRVKTLPSSSPC